MWLLCQHGSLTVLERDKDAMQMLHDCLISSARVDVDAGKVTSWMELRADSLAKGPSSPSTGLKLHLLLMIVRHLPGAH